MPDEKKAKHKIDKWFRPYLDEESFEDLPPHGEEALNAAITGKYPPADLESRGDGKK